MAAPRPWPTWRGPVGLADTNSTCTRRPPPVSVRPYAAPLSRMVRTTSVWWLGLIQKLIKPGPAMSQRSTNALSGSAAISFEASSLGAMPARLASTMAMLHDRSPLLESFGRSIWGADSSTSASTPSDTSCSSASLMSAASSGFMSILSGRSAQRTTQTEGLLSLTGGYRSSGGSHKLS